MFTRKIDEYETYDGRGKAVISIHLKDEMYQIDYYDDHDRHFFCEEFPNKTLRYVEDAAENWVAGIKTLEHS